MQDEQTTGQGGDAGTGHAEIVARDVWINNDGPDPVLKAGQPFTMLGQVCNIGTVASGTFKAKFKLDGGEDHEEQVQSLEPQQCVWVSWSYPNGTTAGDHCFEVWMDALHEVSGDNQENNYNQYCPFNIGDAASTGGSGDSNSGSGGDPGSGDDSNSGGSGDDPGAADQTGS